MNNFNKYINYLNPLKNLYFLILIFFFGWMIFFDGNDVYTQLRLNNKLDKLESEKALLGEKIDQTTRELSALRENKEKFAREKYYMKKDDEDVFVIDKK